MKPKEVTKKLSIALKQPLHVMTKTKLKERSRQVAGVVGKSDADEITRLWFGT